MPSPLPTGSPAAPQPHTVHTVSELAAALKELRLRTPRREMTDELLSLRELSELTGVPRSTLCNAESGRVLPSARVVFHVARACGVTQDELASWVDARHRIARSQSRRTVQAARATTAPAQVDDDQDGIDGMIRIVGRLETADPAAVMPMLKSLPPDAVGQHLATLHAPVAAQHLASMGPGPAAEASLHMSVEQVAECMGWMEPTAAERILRGYDFPAAAELLQRMPTAVAASVISALPAEISAETLSHLPPDALDGIIPGIPIRTREALVNSDRMPDRLAVKLLFGLSFGRIIALFESSYPLERCAELLTAIPGDAAAGLLAALPTRRRRALIHRTGLDEIGRKIAQATAETVADVLDGVAPETSAAVLGEFAVDRAAAVLHRLRHDLRARILDLMPPMVAAVIRNTQFTGPALGTAQL
ncbi:magnesium transporter MgtE N-terminal domain-containing protein [Actinoplanes solisilvae]|uniref:magnesium transporter MgtE N-terminal domain-containing protein n=1 Tax=Actinoplanes solisilvae TaxID=2486853 RepID=UPI000FD91D88|nr:helix-turn-helix domain-containing protein [Actinoplanes solisilvae]